MFIPVICERLQKGQLMEKKCYRDKLACADILNITKRPRENPICQC